MIDLILTEEQKRLQRDVRALTDQRLIPIAHEVDEQEDVSLEVVKILAEANLFRWLTTREFGGPADTVKAVPLCIIREELTRGCAQADTTFAMQGLGSYPILQSGSPELVERWIPEVRAGRAVAAFALTEPGA
ncbi:MAG TPA: acyl-CoA dehydrogenase family protein, partial [Dehalococcoidia bacterium]|nr:acyl-CoA dehydrogenase family protein [Dehalococcoidia bacterium]